MKDNYFKSPIIASDEKDITKFYNELCLTRHVSKHHILIIRGRLECSNRYEKYSLLSAPNSKGKYIPNFTLENSYAL